VDDKGSIPFSCLGQMNFVMLTISLFSLLIAVALSSISVTSSLLMRTTSLILVASAALAANAFCSTALGTGATIYSGLLIVSPIGVYADVLLLLAGAVAILPWAPSTMTAGSSATPSISTYPLFILFTVLGSTCLLASNDLISLYLSIELQSFAVYVLAALYRDSESATHAGLLYFLLGGLSSSLILLGSALVYAYTGHTSFESIMSLLSIEGVNSLTTGLGPCSIGLIILSVGFLFKVTAAPFHNWGPDVYDGVPTIVTTWLAVLPKVSILALLLELGTGLGSTSMSVLLDGVSYNVWTSLLLTCSLLSLLVGTIVGLAQVRIKRLLAYSTISHVGFMLLALAVASEESVEAYLFYLGQYTVTALNAFLVVLALGYLVSTNKQYKDLGYIEELRGLFINNPLLGLSLAASLFSMAGVPPLVGFFGKQAVLYTAIHGGYYFLSFVAIVVSVISGSYYLRVIRVVHFDQPTSSSTTVVPVTGVHSYVIALLTLSISFFLASSGLVLDSSSLVAAALFNV
jgi:NADH-ubiquinone oxidoreductase chain 2